MSRILCVWELGDDFGHLGKFSSFIDELLHRGHEVFFAVKDLSRINQFYADKSVVLLQAPVWLPRLRKPVITNCLAEILLYKGYQSPATLGPLVKAWMNLFDLVAPELIVFDHAPTALLASSGLAIPRVIFSNAFVTPASGMPPLCLRPWAAGADTNIGRNDEFVVNTVNQVAREQNLPTLKYVSDLFVVQKIIFPEFRELDIYRHLRRDREVCYVGPLATAANFQLPVWNRGEGRKVFAYLKFGHDNVESTLAVLAKTKANILCFYSGAKPEHYDKYLLPHMHISNQAYDLTEVLSRADMVICHAGMGLVSRSLGAGLPMMLLPTQLEQINTAKIAEDLRVSITIEKDDSVDVITRKMLGFLQNPLYAQRAEDFALNYKNIDLAVTVKNVCDACEQYLK